MVDSVRKYGVDIEQVFAATAPTPVVPGLIPVVVAPCMEVLESTTASGAVNGNALLSVPYVQQGISHGFTDLPAPRGNISTLAFETDTITADVLVGGKFKRLSRSEAFLDSHNEASRAGLVWWRSAWNNLAVAGQKTDVIFAFDQHVPADTTQDVTVSFDNGLTIDQVVSYINEAVGETVASKITYDVGAGDVSCVLIASTSFGAKSSVTLRGWGESFGLEVGKSYRVVGSGLRGADDADNDTLTPWVEFFQGAAFKDASEEGFGELFEDAGVQALHAVRVTTEDDTGVVDTEADAEDWTDFDLFAATSLKSGDVFYADGVAVAQVTKVEAARFKLGVVDSANSTYDSNGDPIRQTYLPLEVNTMLAAKPFAPANAWFLARGLTGEEVNTAATLTSGVSVAPESAEVVSNDAVTLPPVGSTLVLTVVEDGVEGDEQVLVWTGTPANRAALQAGFAALCEAQEVFSNIACSINVNVLTFYTLKTGKNQEIRVGAGTSNAALGLVAGTTVTGEDATIAALSATTLEFSFDSNPKVFSVGFTSDSVDDAIADINEVVGITVATKSVDNKIVLTSPLKGRASKVEIITGDATIFATGATDSGSGRPSPDFSVNTLLSTWSINPQIIRDTVTGDPIVLDSAPVYFSYEAVRTEVAGPVTDTAITVSNFTDLSTNFGPIDERNPLGLGLFFALNAAGEGTVVKGTGVNAISATEPKGTLAGYLEALSLLRSEEAYFVVPFSGEKEVIDAVDVHVTDMSSAENRGERILISCPANATREADVVVLSGSSAQSTDSDNELDLNDNPGDELVANGVNPSVAIPFELADTRQLYVEFTTGGVTKRYSVARVSGSRITLRSNVAAAKNLDGFYTVTTFSESVNDLDFSLKIRGKTLTVPGTTTLDKQRYAEAIRDVAQQYANRRHLRLYPDTVTTVINGEDKNVSSFYFGCALAGASASTVASTPFSGNAVIGFTNVIGPKLQETHYDIISAGNAVIEAPVAGGNLALRMQCTTDVSTIEKREWSITKAIDAFAKLVRSALKARTGPFNISKSYLDETSLVLGATASVATDAGLLEYAKFESLVQDPEEKTTVAASFVVKPFYAANYIKVTIFS